MTPNSVDRSVPTRDLSAVRQHEVRLLWLGHGNAKVRQPTRSADDADAEDHHSPSNQVAPAHVAIHCSLSAEGGQYRHTE
jgi:hypothetical protein